MTALGRAGEFQYPGLSRYVGALNDWLFPELVREHAVAVLPDGRWRLCLGVLVFGGYVDRFLELCLPSLLAPGNLAAIPDPLVIVHTDAAAAIRLESALEPLRRVARVEIHVLPASLLAMVPDNPANKYWLLGGAHNLHMQTAKYRGHAYHMLMPDHVYATGYFANLARLALTGHHAIVQGGLSAKIEAIGPAIVAAGGAVAPRQLTALALDALHPMLDPFLMNGRDDCPPSLLLLMVGCDAVHIASPHMSIVYLSLEVLMTAPLRLYNTIDGQLPFFIPPAVEPYVPTPRDGMVYAEVSDTTKTAPWQDGCTLDEFCARFWIMCFCHRGFERYFGMTTVLPLPDGYKPPMAPMTDDAIAELQQRLRQAVKESRDPLHALLPEHLRTDPLLRLEELDA